MRDAVAIERVAIYGRMERILADTQRAYDEQRTLDSTKIIDALNDLAASIKFMLENGL